MKSEIFMFDNFKSYPSFYMDSSLTKSKRKRGHNQVLINLEPDGISNASDESDSLDEFLDDSDSMSSSSSSLSNKRYIRMKNNKIMITDDNMTNALRDLQIEMSPTEDNQSEKFEKSEISNKYKIFIDNLNDDTDEVNEEHDCCFFASDQLKKTLEAQKEAILFELYQKNTNQVNNMQLVPWISNPKCEITRFPSYKVEEPDSTSTNIKNLKRRFSELNRISIEEIASNKFDENVAEFSDSSEIYFVDLNEDQGNKLVAPTNFFQNTNLNESKSLKIVDVTNQDQDNSDEKMEF